MFLRTGSTLVLACLLASCGGGGGTPAVVTPPPVTPPAQSISVSGGTGKVILAGDKGVTLTATTAVEATVSWALERGPGTLSASSGNSVTYTPPACCLTGSGNTSVLVTAKAGDVTAYVTLFVYRTPGLPGLSLVTGTVGGAGNLNGKGELARFEQIDDISADAAGNLLVLDFGNVRRVSASGEVSTLLDRQVAKTTVAAISAAPDGAILLLLRLSDGLAVYQLLADGTITQVLAPAKTDQSTLRIVAGAKGTVYMLANNHVSVARADGSGGMLAGNGDDADAACRDGAGSAARLQRINDGVLDSAGNLIVADCYSVRKITPAGVVTTLAGDLADGGDARDGAGKAAHFFNWRRSLAIDQHGELRELDYDFPLYNDDGSGKPISYGLRKISSSGVVTTLRSGTLPGSGVFKASFERQTTAGVPGAYKFVRYLADGTAILATPAQIYKLDGNTLSTLAGNEGDLAGTVEGPAATARILQPQALGSGADGSLYVRDVQGNFYKITPAGQVSRFAADGADWTAMPARQILFGHDGLYVSHQITPNPYDRSRSGGALIEVRRTIDFYLTSTILAGSRQSVAYDAPRVDGAGKDATFWKADLLGFDNAWNLYVEDEQNGKPLYRKVAWDGAVTTVAALPADLDADIPGSTVIQNGYRYLYAPSLGVVYRVGADGNKTVVAGVANQFGIRTGALPGGLASPPPLTEGLPLVPLSPISPNTYAFISGAAILQLVVPPAGGN